MERTSSEEPSLHSTLFCEKSRSKKSNRIDRLVNSIPDFILNYSEGSRRGDAPAALLSLPHAPHLAMPQWHPAKESLVESKRKQASCIVGRRHGACCVHGCNPKLRLPGGGGACPLPSKTGVTGQALGQPGPLQKQKSMILWPKENDTRPRAWGPGGWWPMTPPNCLLGIVQNTCETKAKTRRNLYFKK